MENELTAFLGRFHPLTLHLPIGFLLGLFLVEIYAFLRPSKNLASAAWLLLVVGSSSALVASFLGLFLSWEGGYEEELLSDHRWMGFAVAALSLVLIIIKWKLKTQEKKMLIHAYRLVLTLCILLLCSAGHHGGALTHGNTYLTAKAPDYVPDIVLSLLGEETILSTHATGDFGAVHAIFDKHCFKCHGESKQKGDLRLDQPSTYPSLKGESEELAIVPGNAMASNLVRVITLPRDHEDVMPPEKKPALSPDEAWKIINWVNTGAQTNNFKTTPKTQSVSIDKKIIDKEKIKTIVKEEKKPAGEFATKVWPIFKKRCISCHGPKTKKKKKNPKGGLRLDTMEWIKRGVVDEGEKDSAVYVAGKPKESSLYTLTILPEDDDDIMPPKGDPLTKEQQKIIHDWIKNGAKFEGWTSGESTKEGHSSIINKIQLVDTLSKNLKAVSPLLLKKVTALGAQASSLSEDNQLVQVSFVVVKNKTSDNSLEALSPLANHLAWLNLSGSQISDKGVQLLANCNNLNRLNLSNTKISNAALEHLKNLKNLEHLNLYGTKITDAGLVQLKNLTHLKKLYLWKTKVTQKGTDTLKAALPQLTIILGGSKSK